jgi:hypothetical protein
MTIKIYLQGVQDSFKKCVSYLQMKQMDPETFKKCASAILKITEMMHTEAEELLKSK